MGADADVVIFDPDRRVTLRADSLHQNVDYSPYDGWEVHGYPETVLSRGEIIVRGGAFTGSPGRGHFLRTSPLSC